MQGPKVNQFKREFVVILKRVNERGGIDVIIAHRLEHQAQKLRVAGYERVVIGGPGDEVIREIRAAMGHRRDVIDGQVELLERKTARFAHHSGDQLVADDGEWMALGPRRAIGPPLDAEKAIRVESQHPGPEDVE